MLRHCLFGLCLALGLGSPLRAQESTEPPPPRAAPRGAVVTEELPRAGAIVVFGAERPLGLEIVKALAAANKQVAAVVAEGADTSVLEALKVTVVRTAALDAEGLKETFASMPLRAVVAPFDSAGAQPALGFEGIRNVIDATTAAKLPRFVLVSQTGAGDSAGAMPWYVRFLRGDAAAKAGAAEEHLKAADLDFTIVRAGWVLEDEPAGATAMLREGAAAFSWISAADLARLIAGAVDARALSGKTATALDAERTGLFSALF